MDELFVFDEVSAEIDEIDKALGINSTELNKLLARTPLELHHKLTIDAPSIRQSDGDTLH